jgi:hypothetical protein
VRKDIPQWTASIVVAACVACSGSQLAAQQGLIKVEIARNDLGMPPANFELVRTGEGELGQWTVVRDPTAIDGLAIEHLSTDQHDDRYPLAIYKPLNAENVEVSVRFKIISGTLQSAGVAVCLRNPASYYAVSASALEHRVDLLLVMNGRIERIETSEAEVALNRWHSLGVTINDDHFEVSLDKQVLFTTFERTRMKDGHVALWTQEDNVTRFDQIEIRPLPSPEVR